MTQCEISAIFLFRTNAYFVISCTRGQKVQSKDEPLEKKHTPGVSAAAQAAACHPNSI